MRNVRRSRKRRRRELQRRLLSTCLLLLLGLLVSAFNGKTSLADKEPEYTMTSEEFSKTAKEYKDKLVQVSGVITAMGYTDTKLWVELDGCTRAYFGGRDADEICKSNKCVGDSIILKGIGCGVNNYVFSKEISHSTLVDI